MFITLRRTLNSQRCECQQIKLTSSTENTKLLRKERLSLDSYNDAKAILLLNALLHHLVDLDA